MDLMESHPYQEPPDFWSGEEVTYLCGRKGCHQRKDAPVHAVTRPWQAIAVEEIEIGDRMMTYGVVTGLPAKVPGIELDLLDIPTAWGPVRKHPGARVVVVAREQAHPGTTV